MSNRVQLASIYFRASTVGGPTRWCHISQKTLLQTRRNGLAHCPGEAFRTCSSTNRVFVSSLVHEEQSEQSNNVDWLPDFRESIFWMLLSVFDVECRPGRRSSSVVSRLTLNLLNHSKTSVHFLLYGIFVVIFPNFTRNLRLTRCSIWTLCICPTRR